MSASEIDQVGAVVRTRGRSSLLERASDSRPLFFADRLSCYFTSLLVLFGPSYLNLLIKHSIAEHDTNGSLKLIQNLIPEPPMSAARTDGN